MENQPHPGTQWAKIQKAGLCPEIKTFADYTAKYLRQLEDAMDESMARGILVPGPDEIAAFHQIVFDGIHPWAGQFRKSGQSVICDGTIPGADAHLIDPSLRHLKEETDSGLARAATDQDKVASIARYLGNLRRIHPFLDGNTRTAVVLLYGQMTALFGKRDRPAMASFEFKGMLRGAYEGNVTSLANCILKEEGVPVLLGQQGEVEKAAPALDSDMAAAYQDDRQRILDEQRYGKRRP